MVKKSHAFVRNAKCCYHTDKNQPLVSTLSQMKQVFNIKPSFLKCIYSLLRLPLSSKLTSSDLWTKTLCSLLLSFIRATYLSDLILSDLVTTIFGKKRKVVFVLNQVVFHENLLEEWLYNATILDFDTRWMWITSFTPRPFYPRESSSFYPLSSRPQDRSGHCGEERIASAWNLTHVIQPFLVAIVTELFLSPIRTIKHPIMRFYSHLTM